MRYFLAVAIFLLQCNSRIIPPVFGDGATIYLVRHAEKQSGNDPLLTPAGNARAGDLLRVLKGKNIQRIYVTEYRRTQNTGDSLRIQLGIDTVRYLSDTSCTDLFNKIQAHHDMDKAILIIGHSNTIPLMVRKFGLTDYPADYIPDTEYDNLFLVRFKNGKPILEKMKYGASSSASAAMQ